jgi:hypothetical protein
LLAVVPGGIGLTAWLAKADLHRHALGIALVGFGLYRRQSPTACAAKKQISGNHK